MGADFLGGRYDLGARDTEPPEPMDGNLRGQEGSRHCFAFLQHSPARFSGRLLHGMEARASKASSSWESVGSETIPHQRLGVDDVEQVELSIRPGEDPEDSLRERRQDGTTDDHQDASHGMPVPRPSQESWLTGGLPRTPRRPAWQPVPREPFGGSHGGIPALGRLPLVAA